MATTTTTAMLIPALPGAAIIWLRERQPATGTRRRAHQRFNILHVKPRDCSKGQVRRAEMSSKF